MWGPDFVARCASRPAKMRHIMTHIRLKMLSRLYRRQRRSVMASQPPSSSLSSRQIGPHVGANVGIVASSGHRRVRESGGVQEGLLEAATGVEPVMEVLQTSALPLGYAAPAQRASRPVAEPRRRRGAPPQTKGRRQSSRLLSSASGEGVLERVKGLEPSTFCMASRRSSQLSYTRADG